MSVNQFEMHVRSGTHKDAKQTFLQQTVLIGSSFETNVVLTDEGVAPLHARVHFGPMSAEFEAIGGVLHVNDAHLGPGGKISGNYPALLRLGPVDVEVKRVKSHDSTLPWDKLLILGSVVIAGVAVAMSLGPGDRNQGGASPQLAFKGTPQANAQPVKAAPADNAAKAEAAKAAAASLSAHLSTMDMKGLEVIPGAGTVSVSGVLEEGRKADWHTVERWFDENQGMNVVLQPAINFASKKAAVAPITLQSIWSGKIPYLIDGKGDKYFEGSMLKDGWTVEKIEDGRVYLRRAKDVLILKI